MSQALSDAFRYSKLVLATTTYNASIYPFMHDYITRLTEHNFQNRTVGIIENGSWAPLAAKIMKEMLSGCKKINWLDTTVKVLSAVNQENKDQLEAMASELCKEYIAQNDELANKNDMTALFRIGVVTRSFNQMLDSIRIHIKQQRESIEKQAQMKERELLMETHLKEAQLKYLQAQINPHFLFNCLNAGAQLAMLEDAERTGVFLEKMADFFRYNVRKMEDDALLWEEVDAVDNYIYILNVRFAGDINYEKDVDEGIGNFRIPSMILQPLVENAVQHGIHDCMETGKIRMSIHKDGDDLEITVSDNGTGMTQEMIQSVMAGKARNNGENRYSTGIAVGNVIDRLELYYKQKDLLTIESEGLGLGTSVHITLPVEVEGTSE